MNRLRWVCFPLFLCATLAHADPRVWNPAAAPVRTGEHIQWQKTTAQAEDGYSIAVWTDTRNGNRDIWAQMFDPAFNLIWTQGGVVVCGQVAQQSSPAVCAVPNGWIVSWIDERLGAGYQIYAQKLDRNGVRQWSPDGIQVEGQEVIWDAPVTTVSDGAGGAFFAYVSYGTNPAVICASRIGSSGQLVWPQPVLIAGLVNCPEPTVPATGDGAGNLLIVRDGWGYPARITKVTANGELPWGADGHVIQWGETYVGQFQMCPDGNGGCYVGWISNFNHLSVQRINAGGIVLWDSSGLRVQSGDYYQNAYSLALSCADGEADGCVVAWDVWAQKISAAGQRLWGDNGTQSNAGASIMLTFGGAAADGQGGIVTTWFGREDLGESIRANRVNSNGQVAWGLSGVQVAQPRGTRCDLQVLVSDSSVGVIWFQEAHSGDSSGILYQSLQLADGSRRLADSGVSLVLGLGSYVENLRVVPMSNNRVGLVWEDHRWDIGSPMYQILGSQLFYQILDSVGHPERTLNGEALTPGFHGFPVMAQTAPEVCEDGAGGFFVVGWEHYSGEYGAWYWQNRLVHVNAEGALTTGPSGVLVEPSAPSDQYNAVLAGDGSGGCYIAFRALSSQYPAGVHLCRMNADGQAIWQAPFVSPYNPQTLYGWKLCTNSDGSCMLVRFEYSQSDTTRAFVTRVSPQASLMWTMEACSRPQMNGWPTVVSDNRDGVYLAWSDGPQSAGEPDIVGQHIDSAGVALWEDNGRLLAATPGRDSHPLMSTTTAGELYLVWSSSDHDIYNLHARKFDGLGNRLWGDSGRVLTLPELHYDPVVMTDAEDGLIVAWSTGWSGEDEGIFATHLDSSGSLTIDPWWTADTGGAICLGRGRQYEPALARSGTGWVAAWLDTRLQGSQDTIQCVYAQRIEDMNLAARPVRHPRPLAFALAQNFPNPFNASTLLAYDLPKASLISLRVFDLLGREVAVLKDGFVEAGSHRAMFDGSGVASGIYFARLEAGAFSQTKKLMLLK
jgi:hypothetical protein